MDREQVIKILSYLKVAYPNFYKGLSKQEAEETIAVWQDLFVDCDFKLVFIAIKEIINSSDNPFPPTISEVKQKMYTLTNQETLPTDLWEKLLNAIRNSGYNSVEEFEKLPQECKAFVKSPSQLKELGMMESSVVNSVIKGQFLKQVEIIQKRIKEDKQMLPATKKLREMVLSVGQDVSGLLN